MSLKYQNHQNKSIGIDKLPKQIRESNVLTGNNLGKLGNIETSFILLKIQLLYKSY